MIKTLHTFTLFLAFALTFGIGTAYAQETNASPYAGASDKQISEAQTYYRACVDTPAMNTRKDCKCAATKFLETRVKMGDLVERETILKMNLNSCLKDSMQSEQAESAAQTDYSNVSDKDLQEAEQMYNLCQQTTKYRTRYDCECYAAHYLDKRIELGPIPNQTIIMSHIRNECPNTVNATGEIYETCMSRGMTQSVNVSQKDFCECSARQFGIMLESLPKDQATDFRVTRDIQVQANLYCLDDAAYQPQIPNQ